MTLNYTATDLEPIKSSMLETKSKELICRAWYKNMQLLSHIPS